MYWSFASISRLMSQSRDFNRSILVEHTINKLIIFFLLLGMLLILMSCKAQLSEDTIKKFIESYVIALNNEPGSMINYIHPESTTERKSDVLARKTFKFLVSHTELLNQKIIKSDNEEAKVRAILKITSKMTTPPGFPPLEEMETILFTLRFDNNGSLKIFSEEITDNKQVKGLDIPKLRSTDVIAQVCRTIDPESGTEEVIKTVREQFGKLNKQHLTDHQEDILNAIAAAVTVSMGGLSSSDTISFRSSVGSQVLIDYTAIKRSNIATTLYLKVLSNILPDLTPHLFVLVVNETYLIPLIQKQIVPKPEFVGYDIVHPGNLLVKIDPSYIWIKSRFSNANTCSISDSLFTKFIISD